MQSLAKCYFPLTAYLSDHSRYGRIWDMVFSEYTRTECLLIQVAGESQLLPGNQTIRESIHLREDIVLPLLTIQQYALLRIKELGDDEGSHNLKAVYRKLITRTMPGIINAARNSA